MKFRAVCPNGHDNTAPYTRNEKGGCRRCHREAVARRKRLRYGQAAPRIVCGRLFCPRCSKWRLLCDFPYRDRRYGEQYPTGVCSGCVNARGVEYRAAVKADSERAARAAEANRFRLEARRRAKGVKARNWSPGGKRGTVRGGREVSTTPFLAVVDAYLATTDQTVTALAELAESSPRLLRRLRVEGGNIRLDTVSAWLDAMGFPPEKLHELYPPDGDSPATLRTVPQRYELHPHLRSSKTCDRAGCYEGRGFGPRKAFCREHGKLFARLRDEFEVSEGWFNGDKRHDYDYQEAA